MADGSSSRAGAAGKAKVPVRPNAAGGEGKAVKYFSSVTFWSQLKGFLSGNQILKLKILLFPHVLVTATSFSKEWLQVREVARDKLCFSGCFPEVY